MLCLISDHIINMYFPKIQYLLRRADNTPLLDKEFYKRTFFETIHVKYRDNTKNILFYIEYTNRRKMLTLTINEYANLDIDVSRKSWFYSLRRDQLNFATQENRDNLARSILIKTIRALEHHIEKSENSSIKCEMKRMSRANNSLESWT